MDQAAQKALADGGDGQSQRNRRIVSENDTEQTAENPGGDPQDRAADHPGDHVADGTGIENRSMNRQADIGSENGKARKENEQENFMFDQESIGDQRLEGRGFTEQIGDQQKNCHLLQQVKCVNHAESVFLDPGKAFYRKDNGRNSDRCLVIQDADILPGATMDFKVI